MPIQDSNLYNSCLKRLNIDDASMQVIIADVDKQIQHVKKDMWFS